MLVAISGTKYRIHQGFDVDDRTPLKYLGDSVQGIIGRARGAGCRIATRGTSASVLRRRHYRGSCVQGHRDVARSVPATQCLRSSSRPCLA